MYCNFLNSCTETTADTFLSVLHDMTGGTFLLKRTGTILLVASGTLPMKGVGTFWDLFISFIGVMAFAARACIGVLFLGQGVMTITARYAVTVIGVMDFMIKQYLSRRNIKHQSYGLIGFLVRKRRVA